jgi:hypothetical protein
MGTGVRCFSEIETLSELNRALNERRAKILPMTYGDRPSVHSFNSHEERSGKPVWKSLVLYK